MRIGRKLARQYREGIKSGQKMVARNRIGLPVYPFDFPPYGTPQHRAHLHVVNRELDRITARMTALHGRTSRDSGRGE